MNKSLMFNNMIEWVMFMNKSAKAMKNGFISAILVTAAYFCMAHTKVIADAVSEAVQRCLLTVIPSLYAMMIVSALLVRSGITGCMPNFLSRLTRLFFGLDGTSAAIFSMSIFAGYPVGTSMLLSEYESGRLNARRTELLCGLCFGAGPAFIFGCISGKLYSSPTAGMIILISTAVANIIGLLLMSPWLRRDIPEDTAKKKVTLTADMLTDCMISSGRSMAVICFSVVAFAVISAFFQMAGISGSVGKILSGISGMDSGTGSRIFAVFLDITNVSGLPVNDYSLLPYICGATSFGGVCVLFQLSALVRGRISILPLVAVRVVMAAVSGMVCRVMMPIFMRYELISASAVRGRICREGSAVPSVMLVIMTLMVIAGCEKAKKVP